MKTAKDVEEIIRDLLLGDDVVEITHPPRWATERSSAEHPRIAEGPRIGQAFLPLDGDSPGSQPARHEQTA